MRHLDLFSGIGGFALAASRVWKDEHEIASFCEIEPFCQKVLQKHWPDVPLVSDIRELKGANVGKIDLLTGGFPCQPFSRAGKQKGEIDNRYLWPEMLRIIKKTQPRWIIGENVTGITDLVFDKVLFDLESQNYEVWAAIIPACAVNAQHRRDRVWFMAYSKGSSTVKMLRKGTISSQLRGSIGGMWEYWSNEPAVGRVVNGIPNRVDRLRSLGNAIVPQVATVIIEGIRQVENMLMCMN